MAKSPVCCIAGWELQHGIAYRWMSPNHQDREGNMASHVISSSRAGHYEKGGLYRGVDEGSRATCGIPIVSGFHPLRGCENRRPTARRDRGRCTAKSVQHWLTLTTREQGRREPVGGPQARLCRECQLLDIIPFRFTWTGSPMLPAGRSGTRRRFLNFGRSIGRR